jgi:hypothetical protein
MEFSLAISSLFHVFQIKNCLISSFGDILCYILDAVDAGANLNIDVTVELAEKELVVGYHPLVGDHLYLSSQLVHLYHTSVTTIFWLKTTILGVAVISLLSALEEWLGKIFLTLAVFHARALLVDVSTRTVDHVCHDYFV